MWVVLTGRPKLVGGKDGGHGDQSGAGALGVGEVLLADFLANGDHDALPADHGAQTQRQGHGDLDPGGNELGGLVDLALVVVKSGVSAAVKAGLWFFCIRRMASLVTYMSLRTLVWSWAGTDLNSL